MTRLRSVEVFRGAWGLSLLVAPRRVLALVHGIELDPVSIAVARVLGARQLTQAVVSGVEPSPEVLAMGVWVDAAHAATAFGLAAVDRGRARAGLTDGLIALIWAGIGLHDLRGGGSTPPRNDRRRDSLARLVLGVAPGGGLLARLAARARGVGPG